LQGKRGVCVRHALRHAQLSDLPRPQMEIKNRIFLREKLLFYEFFLVFLSF
jgi:hypothetical protein